VQKQQYVTHEIAESGQLFLITKCIQVQAVCEVSVNACPTTDGLIIYSYVWKNFVVVFENYR